MKKKPLNTASVLKEIIAGLNPDVIKGYEMPTLCNMETAKETGFAVVMVLSTKFDYTNDILDEWMKRLEADDYIISVKHNQLQVRFNVMYAKKRGEITMAANKSFTSAEQSRKLAEILPTESADMEYLLEQWVDEKTGHHKEGYCEIPVVKVDDNSPLQQITLPCWSLAALLDVLPKIHGLKPILDLEECSIQYSGIDLYVTAGNLVDACYEMIIKLHRLKML